VRQISASKDFKIPGGDTFIRVFVIRHELAIENSVYFYVVISLHYTLHAFEHNFDRVFEESARLDIFRVYYNTRQNGFQMPFRFRANGVRTWRPYARIFRAQIPSNSRATRYMRSMIVYY